jgi:hypothetical protein
MNRAMRAISTALRHGVAAFLLAAVLATMALVASPSWHAKAHHDAGDESHECAVTLYASGAWHHAAVLALVVPRFVPVPAESIVERQCVALSFRFSGILEHAPPVTV